MFNMLSLCLFAFFPGVIPQACSCSGHGSCGPTLTCQCHSGWWGPTCAQRSCPRSNAWVGYGGGGTDDVHSILSECSGWGSCATSTGRCSCPAGTSGDACQYLSCPTFSGLPCGGKGKCVSMSAAASAGNADGYSELIYPSSTYNGWEGPLVQGCVCDPGYTGPDCSQLVCPLGGDPLVAALPRVQSISCDCNGGYCSGGAFSVSHGSRSASILASAVATTNMESNSAPPGSGWAPGESVQSVLSTLLPGIVTSVVFTGGLSSACGPGSAISVTFALSAANAHTLAVGVGTLAGAAPVSLYIATTQSSTVIPLPCSGRGKCNAGTCTCYSGYYPSDGNGNQGRVQDCGSLVPPGGTAPLNRTVVTKCLGSGSTTCSNRGWCDTSGGAFTCVCSLGYWGPACEFKSCPLGRAWWDQPAPDGTAHALAPCSNRGQCNSDGTCACFPGYTGSSCNRMTCPSATGASNTCSGMGRCLPLNELVPLGSVGGLPLGAAASSVHPLPPTQTLSCSLGSGSLFITLRNAKSTPLPWNSPLSALILALQNLPGITSVTVTASPRYTVEPASGVAIGYTTPTVLCSAEPAHPVQLTITFPGMGGALPAMHLSAAGQTSSEPGTLEVSVVHPGSLPSYDTPWDSRMIHGCHCDGYPEWNSTSGAAPGSGVVSDRGRWWGPSCSLRSCPSGVIPETATLTSTLGSGGGGDGGGEGVLPKESQILYCNGVDGGSFTLSFRGRVSRGIDFDASTDEIREALQAIPSVGLVDVTSFTNSASSSSSSSSFSGGMGVCRRTSSSESVGGATNPTLITFLTLPGGGLPLLEVDGGGLWSWSGPGSVNISLVRGTRGVGEVAECSGRGLCDTSTGLCNCLQGYSSSDGFGKSGARGDCGKPWGAGGL